MSILFLDKYGYPVEKIKGRTLTNLLRILIHVNIIKSLQTLFIK